MKNMPLLHKYFQHDFQNGFQTNNAILDVVPYKPEVIFIGTYNHCWAWNHSDFYYGRGMYMWPILGNLFLHNQNQLFRQRTRNNTVPSFEAIFNICENGKIVFGDIVKGIKEDIETFENETEKYVLVNNEYMWCSRFINGHKVGEYSDAHLDNMGNAGWLDDNVDAIIDYINNTPSIKHIFFTFKSGSRVVNKLNAITERLPNRITYCSIFTPTANGFGKNLNPEYRERAWSLAHCWLWNGLNHAYNINRPGYGHLNHEWLINNGVNPNNF